MAAKRTRHLPQIAPHSPLRHSSPRQKQNLLLLPRRKVQQIHDLRDPRTRNPAQPGQIGVVPDNAGADQPVEMDGERHQAGNSWNRVGRWGGFFAVPAQKLHARNAQQVLGPNLDRASLFVIFHAPEKHGVGRGGTATAAPLTRNRTKSRHTTSEDQHPSPGIGRNTVKTLVIADIHQKIHIADKVLAAEKDYDEVVFLGDWFDSFQEPPIVAGFEETCDYLRGLITDHPQRKKFVFLPGNHDMGYIFHNNGPSSRSVSRGGAYYCSGFTRTKAKKFRHAFYDKGCQDAFFIANFKPAHQSQGFTFSHAGIHPAHIPVGQTVKSLVEDILPEVWKNFRRLDTQPHNWLLSGAGRARGGQCTVGGITWLDWHMEFVKDESLGRQIMGHTKLNEPDCRAMGTNAESWNLDTEQDYAVITDGRLVTKRLTELPNDAPRRPMTLEEYLQLSEFIV
jgi:hypothetical protein